jgi:hypothetical protein
MNSLQERRNKWQEITLEDVNKNLKKMILKYKKYYQVP